MARNHAATPLMLFTLFVVSAAATVDAALIQYFGPDPYTSADDSPFDTKDFGFCIEDFENLKLDVPGVTGNGTPIGAGGLTDSVDGDDGTIDGSGTNGHSYFGSGATGIIFTFDPLRTHGLPTAVGIVWTDGGFDSPVTFEAFDPDGVPVANQAWGPFMHADNSNNGETGEDRFYGSVHAAGISRIRISNPAGGIEVDHLQLDRCILCGDANFDLQITAPDALIALKTAVGTDTCKLCACDTNNSTTTSTTDALAILRKSVGLTPSMNCPACPELSPV